MSFSSRVKEELSRKPGNSRHCMIAELAAIISMCGCVTISGKDEYRIRIHTENLAVARKYFTLLKKTFNINTEISIRNTMNTSNALLTDASGSRKNRTCTLIIQDPADAMKVLEAVKLVDARGEIREDMSAVSNVVIQNECCRRAFIRGAFLAAGSFSDPEKFYHFEIVCQNKEKAEQLKQIIRSFSVEAKVTARKKYFIVYIKDSSGIVDILNIMEAHARLMELENIRILKEMRNTVNRKVNCETANINKTISASVKQIQDIELLEASVGFDNLNNSLREIAELRLANPDASLKELGEMLMPPVGKSGVNHRLRKLSEMADKIRRN